VGWLAGFVELLWSIIREMWPTVIVEANEVGIRFTLGFAPKVVGPGVRRSLPIVENIEVINPLPQWLDLPEQVVTTSDNESILLSGAIYYEIKDPYLLYMKVQDWLRWPRQSSPSESPTTSTKTVVSTNSSALCDAPCETPPRDGESKFSTSRSIS